MQHRKDEEEQVGLVLPNGRIVWPPDEYKGYPLDTPQARYILLKVLKKSAEDLDFEEEAFISQYHWATRVVTVVDGDEYDIDDDEFFVVEISDGTVTPIPEPDEFVEIIYNEAESEM